MSTYKDKNIVVKVTEGSIMVYDSISKEKIDLFPNDDNGQEKCLQVIYELLND